MHRNKSDSLMSDRLMVAYGPHDFPGGPRSYLRLDDGIIASRNIDDVDMAHDAIKNSLEIVFTDPVLISKINTSFNRENDFQNFIHLNFINYGNTELVYKATLGRDNHIAVLINQPHTPLGVVKTEFENLESLAEMDDRFIVRPKVFFSTAEFGHEFYVTEYIPNALCIAHDTTLGTPHGVYNPNPYYHFENFSEKQSSIINSSIIALLINYYDRENQRGIAQTQVSGNDFIFIKNNKRKDIYKTPYDIKLIAARGFVNASFEEYYHMLLDEFCIGTVRDYEGVLSGKIKINHKSVLPMTKEEILMGISLGMNLCSSRLKRAIQL